MQHLLSKLRTNKSIDKIASFTANAGKAAGRFVYDRNQNPSFEEAIGDNEHKNDDDFSFYFSLISKERLNLVINAIGQLKGLSRDVFIMRYFDHHTYDTIANQMGITKRYAMTLGNRALLHLKYLLSSDIAEYEDK
jgi:DNA-directed RNA polymerase specialized sigma24 family protein